MGQTEKKTTRRAPTRRKVSEQPKGKSRGRRKASEMVEKVLKTIEEKIENADLKPTVGDYLRLLQFRKEIELDEQPKEIKVTWVEAQPIESESAE